jgi:predicted site-specific integrase-resolvase
VKKWAYAGKIEYIKTPGGKYRCPESEIGRLLGEQMPKGKVAVYVRVNSTDQKGIWGGRSRNS